MKKKSILAARISLAALLCGGLFTLGHAASPATAYFGVGGGTTRFGYTSSTCSDQLGYCSLSSTDSNVRIFAGYNVTSNIALELAYDDFGKITGIAYTDGLPGTLSETNTAADFSIVGKLPLASKVFLTGRFGEFASNISANATVFGYSASESSHASNLFAGLGAGYDFTPHIEGKLEFMHYNKAGDSGSNIDTGSVSLAYNF